MAKMVDCPRCGGIPEYDDEGRPYSCFFCCDAGVVPEGWALEDARAAAWAYYISAEKAIEQRVALGVPAGWSYRLDEYEGVVMIPPRELTVPKVWGPDAVSTSTW